MLIAATVAVFIAILVGAFIVRKGYKTMSAALDRLTAEVAETRSANKSILALVAGLSQQIRDNAEDPAKLNALADSLDEGQAELAAAVTANTPAADVADEEAPTE